MRFMVQVSAQQPAALKILGPLAIVLGAMVFVAALLDPGPFFARWYEEFRDKKTGFEAVSASPRQFRTWWAESAVFVFAIGVGIVVKVF